MDSPSVRPARRFDLHTVTWGFAVIHVVVCVGYTIAAANAAAKTYSNSPIDFSSINLFVAVAFTMISLLSLGVAVALLWRGKGTSVFAIVAHSLFIIPGILVLLSALPHMERHPDWLLQGFSLAGLPLAVLVLSIVQLSKYRPQTIQNDEPAQPALKHTNRPARIGDPPSLP